MTPRTFRAGDRVTLAEVEALRASMPTTSIRITGRGQGGAYSWCRETPGPGGSWITSADPADRGEFDGNDPAIELFGSLSVPVGFRGTAWRDPKDHSLIFIY